LPLILPIDCEATYEKSGYRAWHVAGKLLGSVGLLHRSGV